MTSDTPLHPSPSLIDPETVPVGTTVPLREYAFTWDGNRFICEPLSYALIAVWWRQVIRFLITACLAGLIAWLVMSGLDWEAMTLDERRPYSVGGRIVAVGLLAMLIRLVQGAPWTKIRKLDQKIREQYGIGH